MRYRTIIIAVILSPVILFALEFTRVLILQEWMTWNGFHVSHNPADVAKIAAAKHDAKECLRLRHVYSYVKIAPGPTEEADQWECIFRTAKLLNNPLACSLLLPNEYGMDCIGNIWGPLADKSNCHWYQDDSVRCFEGKELIPRVTVCDHIYKGKLPDECRHRIAFRNKDAALCEAIENITLRAVCVARINAWNQYPQLRSTRYFSSP